MDRGNMIFFEVIPVSLKDLSFKVGRCRIIFLSVFPVATASWFRIRPKSLLYSRRRKRSRLKRPDPPLLSPTVRAKASGTKIGENEKIYSPYEIIKCENLVFNL